jgi:hypothetical protein
VPATAPNAYSDSPAGLKNLVKEIMKAQKENDIQRAGALLGNLIVPELRKVVCGEF